MDERGACKLPLSIDGLISATVHQRQSGIIKASPVSGTPLSHSWMRQQAKDAHAETKEQSSPRKLNSVNWLLSDGEVHLSMRRTCR